MKRFLLAILAMFALAAPATAVAQDRVPLTARYDYEWVHLNMGDGSDAPGSSTDLVGAVFLGDTTTSTPRTGSNELVLRALIRNVNTDEVILDCNLSFNIIVDGASDNSNIVEVGPFAQEAHGNAANFLDDAKELIDQSLLNPCISHRDTGVPDSLTVDCEFQGLQIFEAPDHHTFTTSGRYVGDSREEPGTFSQKVQHGPIRCLLEIDGVEYETHGHLTRMQETRRGINVAPRPPWEEPHDWISPADLR